MNPDIGGSAFLLTDGGPQFVTKISRLYVRSLG